jgi:hypothetical protein
MPDFLKRATRFRAHAATSLANAEAAGDEASRRAHLAIARHFYSLAEEEISKREARRLGLNSAPSNQTRPLPAPAVAMIDAG